MSKCSIYEGLGEDQKTFICKPKTLGIIQKLKIYLYISSSSSSQSIYKKVSIALYDLNFFRHRKCYNFCQKQTLNFVYPCHPVQMCRQLKTTRKFIRHMRNTMMMLVGCGKRSKMEVEMCGHKAHLFQYQCKILSI